MEASVGGSGLRVVAMFDYRTILADLEALYYAASEIEGWDKNQAATFIRVGEYGLALEEIAYAYLNSATPMPGHLFQIFERLAVQMELEGDEEYEDVAQLRAETKARLA